MSRPPRDRFIYLAFFLSGVAGLIYQVVWTRYLGILLGSSGASYIIVLATFMGGLGIGAWLLGRAADRWGERAWMLFVLLEAGIALYAALFPAIFWGLRAAFLGSAQGLDPGSTTVLALKVVTAIAAILLPTILMGGTLPVLSRFLVRRLAQVGHEVSHLYYINSFGAVFGALLAGFFLIMKLGLGWSMGVGAVLDFLVAGIVLARRRSWEAGGAPLPATEGPDVDEPAEIYPSHIGRLALLVIGLSGMVSMIYEVVWIRMLALVLGSSTYSFSLMVATFIFGITVGSFLLTFKRTDREFYPLLGYLEILIGLSLLFSLPVYMQLPYIFNQLQGFVERTEESFLLYQGVKLVVCFIVMVIPTLFIGMTLPAASKVATRELGTLGRQVGAAFAINTAGTLVGAVLGGALLMPWLGLKGSLYFGIALNLGLGALVLLTAPPSRMVVQRKAGLALVAFNALIGVVVTQQMWDERVLARAVFRHPEPFESYGDYWAYVETLGDILYYEDGLDATIAVIDRKGLIRGLTINGKPDASVGADVGQIFALDMPTQYLLGHIPMLFHPDPGRVLVVGQGSGVTAGAVASYPDVEVDVVELSPEVAETAPYFAPANRSFHLMPNVRLIVEDARTHLALTGHEYDVIVTEPSNPWTVGNASLFTREFFADCAEHLADDGFMLQWVHYYEMDNASLRLILRTFSETFPYFSIWEMTHGDFAILGSKRPFEPDFDVLRRHLNLPNVASDLAEIGLDFAPALLRVQLFNAMEGGHDIGGDGPLNSEYLPLLEYGAPLGFFLREPSDLAQKLDQRPHPDTRRRLWIHEYEQRASGSPPNLSPSKLHFLVRAALFRNQRENWEGLELLRLWKSLYPEDPVADFIALQIDDSIPPEEKLAILREDRFLPLLDLDDFNIYVGRGYLWMAKTEERLPDELYFEALDWFEKWEARRPQDAEALDALRYMYGERLGPKAAEIPGRAAPAGSNH